MNIGLVNVVSQKDEDNIEKDLSEKQKMILDNLYRCRDLEINNLWQKSIFLTPFLILCFTGYGFLLYELVKEDGFKYKEVLKYKNLVKYEQVINIDTSITKINILCIALCAVSALFSILWILMFKGSKAQFELCERAIANYEQKELKIPYGYAMGRLRHNEIEFEDALLNTKAGKFSPSKVNILIGQLSLVLWSLCIFFHIGYIAGDILRAFDIFLDIPKWVFLIFVIVFSIMFLIIFLYGLKGKVKSSYLSENKEENYVRNFIEKEVKNKQEKNKESTINIIENNRKISLLIQKNYDSIGNERISFTEKELIYIDFYKYLIELGKINISRKGFRKSNTNSEVERNINLSSLASMLNIDKKQVEKLNNYIREKYHR